MRARTASPGATTHLTLPASAHADNSGGPVSNRMGEVIGVINTRQEQAQGVVFAISSKNIFRTIHQLGDDSSNYKLKVPVASTVKGCLLYTSDAADERS